MKKIFDRFVVMFCAAFIALAQPPVYADDAEDVIQTLQAAFIRKFSEFISWPENISPTQNNTVNVCVLGESEVTAILRKFSAKGKAELSFNTSVISAASQAIGNCHIVYVSKSGAVNAQSAISQLEGQPILTISYVDNFAQNGGMIGFELVKNKIRYNVNTKSLSKSGLRIDPQLLEIANEVIE